MKFIHQWPDSKKHHYFCQYQRGGKDVMETVLNCLKKKVTETLMCWTTAFLWDINKFCFRLDKDTHFDFCAFHCVRTLYTLRLKQTGKSAEGFKEE